MIELKIDPEFRDKIPAMTNEQFSGLREDILKDGYVRDPLVVWEEENTLLDGHHRWKIICENWETLKDKYTIDNKSFPDRWAALEWICRNQLNKHNLNDEQITYIRGEMYKARKKSVGNTNKRNADGTFGGSDQLDQNDPNGERPKSTAEAIARELGVAEPTIKRSEKFHDGIDALREVSPEAADKVMRGGSRVKKQDIMNVPKMEPEQVKELAKAIEKGPAETKKVIQGLKPSMRMEDFNATPLNPEPYNAEDFLEQIKDFPNQVDSVFRCFLELHGDLLSDSTCKAAFRNVLMESKEIINKYFVEVTNK